MTKAPKARNIKGWANGPGRMHHQLSAEGAGLLYLAPSGLIFFHCNYPQGDALARLPWAILFPAFSGKNSPARLMTVLLTLYCAAWLPSQLKLVP